MILTGVIENIFPEESRGNFRWTTLWLKQDYAPPGERINTYEIKFFNDEGSWLKKYSSGQLVNVNVVILGAKKNFQGRDVVYTTIRGLKIEKRK